MLFRSQSSWQDFFDTYWNLIFGVAVKGGLTRSEAEDVVQETMISVAKHMPGFQYNPAIGSFKAWLLNMTRWRITDQLRKRGPQVIQPESAEDASLDGGTIEGEPASPDLEKLWDAEWEKNLLKAAIAKARRRLDPKQYQVFHFYVNKEWSPERVAKAFDIPTGQVYLAKHRVMEVIRQEVERLRREVV